MHQSSRFTMAAAILAVAGSSLCTGQVKSQIDFSKPVVISPFGSFFKEAHGLPDSTRTAVIQFLNDAGMFPAVLTPEEAKDKDKSTLLELGATLSDFKPGNMATRLVVGLGTGRAHAGFDFTIKDAGGGTVWQKKIQETASFWSNSASSISQRQELPEKVAKTLVRELQKIKVK
ncbi:MAG TPA: hypothetical protein VGR73_05675 [Bryobacteraceae bacterium]|nr:hypothetical protein [Bryobacteraceae bacterium]